MNTAPTPHLASVIEEGKALLSRDPDQFGAWIVAAYQAQETAAWAELLHQLYGLRPSSTSSTSSDSPDSTDTRLAATLLVVRQLLVSSQVRLAYLLYTPLIRAGILPSDKVLDLLLSFADDLENSPTNDPERRFQTCLQLREMAFELDPTHRDNLQVLLFRALQTRDELAILLYGQALQESLEATDLIDLTKEKLLTQILTQLLDGGYQDLFFEISTTLQARLIESQRSGFAAVLAQLAAVMDPERAAVYEGLWTVEDLVSDFFNESAHALFRDSKSDGYSILGESLLRFSEQAKDDFILYLSLLSESLVKLMNTSQPERIGLVIKKLDEALSSRNLESLVVNDENIEEVLTIARTILFRICFSWSYLSDNRPSIRSYQQLGGRLFSNCINLMASQKNFLWSDYWRKSKQDYQVNRSVKKKLRIGFLGNCFQRHSVGFLSEATLRYISRNYLEVSYYYYHQGWKTEEAASLDTMYQRFKGHNNLNFRFFGSDTLASKVAACIREDHVDILVFMDSLTSHDATVVAALRAAPIQIGWLGGDAVGLPEFDYFFADPYILPEDAQPDYREEIIRLPSYCAVEHLDVIPADETEFRSSLRLERHHVVFLTAASAYKRTPECIDAHLQILKQVPNGILIVKGSGEIATVIRRYQARARELGVLDRVRFLEKAKSVEEHRGQLGLVDLVLDTFPYTGATHTMEALYMGVPVLTLVGRHYYGRMSYSLLKNIGLDDCITWSGEEFIERGIQLGNDRKRLEKAKQVIWDSYDESVIWNPKRLARAMEKVYFDLAYKHQLIDQIPDLPEDESEPKPTEPIRLHIGGKEPRPGWKILDIQPGAGVDYVGNGLDLSQFPDNSLEAIYASHVLEHFNYTQELPLALKEWHRALRFGGQLMISVPDLPTLCHLYLKKEATPAQRFAIMRMMFGEQVDEYDYHKVGLSWEYLFMLLNQAGFRVIRKVDQFDLFNDCSQITVFGESVSLNVVAVK